MESKEWRDAIENGPRVAAFFDLDGTLIRLPSLEKRFFRTLRYRHEIPFRSYLWWLREALRLLPRGFRMAAHSNKIYLRNVSTLHKSGAESRSEFSAQERGHQAGGQASAPPRLNPRLPVPPFFADAVERVVWHARQGHAIVIASGTLEPLADAIALELEAELAARGVAGRIRVCATKLEEIGGRWTGRILGEAKFGEAKARTVSRLAEELQLDLGRSYAYGDTVLDAAMLAIVGQPAAVNPSRAFARTARKRGWALLKWNEERSLTWRRGKPRENQSLLRQAEPCA